MRSNYCMQDLRHYEIVDRFDEKHNNKCVTLLTGLTTLPMNSTNSRLGQIGCSNAKLGIYTA